MMPNEYVLAARAGVTHILHRNSGRGYAQFLGWGAQPPEPSWGSMLSAARQWGTLAPWVAIFPGAAIMLAVLGFNLLGDGLRDELDPRMHHTPTRCRHKNRSFGAPECRRSFASRRPIEVTRLSYFYRAEGISRALRTVIRVPILMTFC